MSLSLVIGIGILAFLFLYFAFQLNEQHFLLKLLLIFFFCFSIILIPKSIINDTCTIEVQNATVTGSRTDYEYNTFCDSTVTGSERSFLKIPLWFFRIFVIYFSVYIFYHWTKKSEAWAKIWGK